ncbi:hypothetical protein WJR50_14095 [Catalinimonas sp. 4WD22]|uniref:hypothetical protein n=1 Tax=Catalinimonas locisalis TaxID=3133978 RepID=UPI003100B2D5
MKHTCLLSILLLLSGCGEVYIPDPVELRIPKYTEDGNQVAGAIINGESWKTEYDCGFLAGCDFPLQISSFPNADSLVLIFYGRLQEGLNKGKSVDLKFVFKNQTIEDFWDLLQLKDSLFIVDSANVLAGIGDLNPFFNDSTAQTYCNRGQMFFRKAEHIAGDQDNAPSIILAGTFGLECDQNGEIATVYKGRFDFSLKNIDVYF